MNEDIIIDGYNLLNQYKPSIEQETFNPDFEAQRTILIQLLCDYKRIRAHKIAVVFDGWQSGALSQSSYMDKGIKIIFSKKGEKADDVIKKIASEKGKKFIIVTSDSDVKNFAQRTGNAVISSQEFLQKIELAKYMNIKGISDSKDEEQGVNGINTKKIGNAKKLPKKERFRNQKLKKL